MRLNYVWVMAVAVLIAKAGVAQSEKADEFVGYLGGFKKLRLASIEANGNLTKIEPEGKVQSQIIVTKVLPGLVSLTDQKAKTSILFERTRGTEVRRIEIRSNPASSNFVLGTVSSPTRLNFSMKDMQVFNRSVSVDGAEESSSLAQLVLSYARGSGVQLSEDIDYEVDFVTEIERQRAIIFSSELREPQGRKMFSLRLRYEVEN